MSRMGRPRDPVAVDHQRIYRRVADMVGAMDYMLEDGMVIL